MNFVQNTPIFNKINVSGVQFRSNSAVYTAPFEHSKDSFSTNPITDINALAQAARTNSKIAEILAEYKIPVKFNTKELEKLQQGHLKDTRLVAAKMYSALPENIKSEVNLKDLQEAAMFHDYGKALIPEKILNKEGKFNEKEKEIMELHSELGYELLKGFGVNENVLQMIKYHHQTSEGSGYPAIGEDFSPNAGAQILSAADKYSALREERSYKSAMSRDEALKILYEDVKSGLITPEIYSALEKAV